MDQIYYRAIVEDINDAVFLIKEEKIFYANNYAIRMLGFSKEELVGKNFLDFIVERDKDKVLQDYKKTLTDYISPKYSATVQTKDKEEVTTEISTKKIIINDETLILAIVRNNSIREKLEIIFKEQEERLYNLTEHTPDMIARLDEECRYIYVNNAMKTTFNLSQKEFFWKTNEDLGIKKEEVEILKEAVSFVFKNKRKKSFYSKTIINNSQKYYFTILIPELYKDGVVKSVLLISRDITEIKEIDQVKSDFISTTTHQLRSPLSIVKWCSLSLLEEELTEAAKEYVRKIQKASKDLIKITDVFLNTTILDLEMFILSYKDFNVKELLEESIFSFKYIIEEKETNFNINCDSSLKIKFDENVFKIIVKGLLSNALEYTEKGGVVNLSIFKDGEEVVVIVSDNGCGIPENEQKKVFTKFYRSSLAKNIRAYGTGLDLYIIKSFVEKANGSIKIESPNPEFNKGTMFTIKLPVVEK